ncbi:MAG TPA: aminotransferase class V-fold PLP-dependent enzyme [Phototrophicaceae bacterium]|jgi:selenocysteine lyase/cysteine desulfurase|nr:aminotransferase class V-fold PLP-dependent enzyme [Phototrophicaceae bacterium]
MDTQAPAELAEITEACRCFIENYPNYVATSALDDLRTAEYARLDDQGHIYLDYTGGGLYAASQLKQHMELLATGVYGNPHSSNPTSQAATRLDESAREYVLRYFNASPDEYLVIFTANASGALKLLGESYPFAPGGRYLLTFDNHNSVNGIREFAQHHGATVTYTPVIPPDLRIDAARLEANLDRIAPDTFNLFAFPAQSNFSGVQHDLGWIERAQAKGWDVLLDAAAFAPTNRLDLSQHKPDFMSLSFYKIFGYPTGLGALIARRDKLPRLRRPWFAGGTITIATVSAQKHYLHEGSEAFEDGTIDYLNLPGVEIGLKHIEKVGVDQIHERVVALTGWLLDQLTALKHGNGASVVRIYGPTTPEMRGGTIALNFYDPSGTIIDYRLIEKLANDRNISLRTGCFCNPGAGETALGLTQAEIECALEADQRMTLSELMVVMGRVLGAVRVSVGIVSNFTDVYHFMDFAREFIDRPADEVE